MNLAEVVVVNLPLIIALAAMVFLVRKTGALDQRAHRQRIEALLERIAIAVEQPHRKN